MFSYLLLQDGSYLLLQTSYRLLLEFSPTRGLFQPSLLNGLQTGGPFHPNPIG